MGKGSDERLDLDSMVFKPLDVSERLERSLGLYGLIAISLSATLGSTLFVIPALGADVLAEQGGTGAGLWLAFIVAGFVVLPSALSKAELGTAMPSSGGSYVYIRQTYGAWMGMISGSRSLGLLRIEVRIRTHRFQRLHLRDPGATWVRVHGDDI